MTRPPSELELWAASGAMALTGRADGPPMAALGHPASAVWEALERIRAVHPATALPGVEVLGERAAAAGLSRRAPWSCGGAFRIVPTADGRLALSLPRVDDIATVPALVSAAVDDPWRAVASWASQISTAEAVARGRLLGLACSPVEDAGALPARNPAIVVELGRREINGGPPLVVDFTSLWAGPVCARLLGLCGADVVKVESLDRLDGARRGPTVFYDVLHAGHRSVTIDFGSPTDLERLKNLVQRADLVLEASRPRALGRLGLVAEDVVASGTSWLSITAQGRDEDVIGFGDDVAAGAGLVTEEMYPCGDALADPLTGVTAAAHAVEALTRPEAVLIDVSMLAVAQSAATGTVEPHGVVLRDGAWWVESDTGRVPVAAPRIQPGASRAATPGRDNEEIL